MMDPAYSITLALALGLAIGSFLNVVIHRLPRMLEREWRQQCAELRGETSQLEADYNLLVPRSACPACGHHIAWHENIPVLSFLMLGGRCAECKTPISWRYPAVELITGLLFGLAVWQFGVDGRTLAALALLGLLIALAFIDLDAYLLPDSLTLPLLWLGLLVNLQSLFVPLDEAVIGAMAGYSSLWAVYWLFKLATGKEGMGYGDFKLLAGLGAWLGWKMILTILLASSIVGASVGIGLILFAGHDRARPIPFGPYLVMGGIVCLFWGPALIRLYLP
ncbi:MAG: prepilin peptidase [Betaproteobacteria bacterium]|nr:prepilin peptidase [Betaproteobacteria bacterium]